MLLVEILALGVSFGFGSFICGSLSACVTPAPASLLPFVLGIPIALWIVGLMPGRDLAPAERSRRRFAVMFAALFILALHSPFVQPVAAATLYAAVAALPLLAIPHGAALLLRGWIIRKEAWGIPVVILGAGHTGQTIARALVERPALGLVPIGFLDDDPNKWHGNYEGIPVLGPLSIAYSQFMQGRARAAVLAVPSLSGERMAELVEGLPFRSVLVVPNLGPNRRPWRSARDLGATYAIDIKKNLLARRYRIVKRALDYVLTVPLAVVGLPLIVIFGILIKIASRGPIFFRQERFGRDGRCFNVIKLRTMCSDAEARLEAHLEIHPEARREWEANYKLKNDPRIIPIIGKFLRMTSLDELPQIWNILRGDMGLVGPRPFTAYHLACFDGEFRALRQTIRPGLTGLWQVDARSNGDTAIQQKLDTQYLCNWSLWLDLTLLFRTVWAVISTRGAF